jgi:hypothetical protein
MFSLSDFDNFLCICLLNICLSLRRYLLLFAQETHYKFHYWIYHQFVP